MATTDASKPAKGPEDLGVDPGRLEHATALIEGWCKQGLIPGATLCIARNGHVLVQRGFGEIIALARRDARREPTRPDTIFLIASPTKPVTAAAVCLLVERGRLLLEDPVSAIIPEFRGGERERVRIRHLLTHTSGLPDMLPENVELRSRHAPVHAFAEGACTTPLLYNPGSDCRYQSMGIALLGAIVERIAGVPLREFIARELFQPLGMVDSWLGLGPLPRERVAQVRLPAEDAATSWNWNSDYWRDLGAPWGGMHSTVGDYMRFMQMLLDGGRYSGRQILSRPMVETILADHIATLSGMSEEGRLEHAWGLGWRLNRPRGAFRLPEIASPRTFGHPGSTGTVAWADPDSGLACALFTSQPAAGRLLGLASNAVAAVVMG